jgi:hypothetical protein
VSAKTLKRILYGVIGTVLLVVAGHEMVTAGLKAESAMAGGLGLAFAFMGATGAG